MARLKQIKLIKNMRFHCISIYQGDKFICNISLEGVQELVNDYNKDITILENMGE